MKVEFTKDIAERTREIPSWGLFSSTSIVAAAQWARNNGWEQKKVQVRWEKTELGDTYYVEPYEEGCGCNGILRYSDFFDRPSKREIEG